MLKRRNSGTVNRTDDAVAEAYRTMSAKKMVMVENEEIDESHMSDLDVQRQELIEKLEAIASEIDEAMIPRSGKAARLVRDAISSLESIATGGQERDEWPE